MKNESKTARCALWALVRAVERIADALEAANGTAAPVPEYDTGDKPAPAMLGEPLPPPPDVVNEPESEPEEIEEVEAAHRDELKQGVFAFAKGIREINGRRYAEIPGPVHGTDRAFEVWRTVKRKWGTNPFTVQEFRDADFVKAYAAENEVSMETCRVALTMAARAGICYAWGVHVRKNYMAREMTQTEALAMLAAYQTKRAIEARKGKGVANAQ